MEQCSLFHLFNIQLIIPSHHLCLNFLDFLLGELWQVIFVDVAVNIQRNEVLRGLLCAAHAEERTESLEALQLILKDVAPTVAALYQ